MFWPETRRIESQKCLPIHSSSNAEQRWGFENKKYIRDWCMQQCEQPTVGFTMDWRTSMDETFFVAIWLRSLATELLVGLSLSRVDFKLYFYLFFSHRCWKDSVTFRNSLKSFRYLCKLLLAAAVCAPTKYRFQYLFLFWTHLSRLKCIQKQMIYKIEQKNIVFVQIWPQG